MSSSRREFLKRTTAIAVFGLVHDWSRSETVYDRHGQVLPRRKLIRDGTQVTAFCLGGYHAGIPEAPQDAQMLLERAMELGVRFYDNARGYHRGRSEEYMGKFLTPRYRDEIFLMTKSHAKTAEAAKEHLEASLRALNTDHLDLWQIHHLDSPDDVDERMNNGILDVFLEAKASGKTKYIGFTGHRNPTTHLHFLKFLQDRGLEMDTCQMPLNICDPSYQSFQKHVLPVLLQRDYGVIAMKTMAGGSMMGKRIDTTPAYLATEDIPDVVSKGGFKLSDLHRYVYALPVSSLCSGCDSIDKLEHNVGVLTGMHSMNQDEMDTLVARARPFSGFNVENYKRVLGA